jgi:ribosomal-protein-alanine N-acetyltransferase
MRLDDLDEVLAIERVSFPHPWSRRAFHYELRENRVARLWVARSPEGPGAPVIAYLCLWFVAHEVHVTNFAVHPAHRHRGIGRRLMGTLLELYRQQGAARVALEVRPSNHEARRLYESFGFRQVGLRKGYYFDTGEDALLMEAILAPDGTPGREEPPARRAAGNPRTD